MLRRQKRTDISLSLGLQPSAYPAFVIPNNSLAGIDRVNKIYVPLHLFRTPVTKTNYPKMSTGAKKVNIIPPLPSPTSSKVNQHGSGKEDPLDIMQYPIKV